MAANDVWVWIDPAVILAVHEEQLAEHGGAAGLRDAGLLDSALARPRNLAQYGEPDAADLAASCAFGLARNHPFVDGNGRSEKVEWELIGNDGQRVPPIRQRQPIHRPAGEGQRDESVCWVKRGR